MPIYPLSWHAGSVLTRQVETGLPARGDLDVGAVVELLNPTGPELREPAVQLPARDWAAANKKKKEAMAVLASLSAT